MFDFRYHAVSLAAVFIALVVGLLLGVAIGDANLVSNAEHKLVDSLQARESAAQANASALQAQLGVRGQFENEALPGLVGGRLTGKRYGLVFLGDTSDQIDQLVAQALESAGGQLVTVVALREPPILNALAGAAASSHYGAIATDTALLRPFGARIGAELVTGTGRLLQLVRSPLMSAENGPLERLDGVIIARGDANDATNVQSEINTFDAGLGAGLSSAGVPVVGVETGATNPSNVPWYTEQNFSSVDDLDDIAGRAALVFTLSGAHRAFGFKSTASAILPQLPLSTTLTATATTAP